MKLIRPQPAQLGTKVTDIEQALRLVLHYASGSSLRLTTGIGAAIGVITISSVALHKWMKRLGPYLTVLLSRMVSGAAFAPERWAGFHVIAGDATTVQRPGSKGTTARVHYALRLADLSARHIEVTDDKGGETARRFRAEPGELWLLDRGYSNPPGIDAIRDRGAHIIVRYNRGTLPVYDARGERIDVAALLQSTTERAQAHERQAVVHFDGKRIVGRLCWLRLPEDKAVEARERVVRETGDDCDAETLAAAEFVVVFSTVQHELSAAQILDLYRVRWQIELDFKRAKSIRNLDCLPNFLPETICSWICAKLILQLIAMRIASRTVAVSPESPNSDSSPTSRTRQRRLAAAVAEPWYVAQLVWDVVCSALLPVALHDISRILERLVEHIRRANERQRRPRQLDVIRRLLSSCGHRFEAIAG
jgi:Transposase DDE domain